MLEPLAALGRFVYVCFDQNFPRGPEKPFPNGSFTEADTYKQPKKHVGGGHTTKQTIRTNSLNKYGLRHVCQRFKSVSVQLCPFAKI